MVIDVAKMQTQLKEYKKKETKGNIKKILKKFDNLNKPITTRSILKQEKSTLTIQKPRDNTYVNRFFDEEWAND